MKERMIRQKEMKNRQIKNGQGLMESSRRKYNRISPPGGGIPRKFSLTPAIQITLHWDGLHVILI